MVKKHYEAKNPLALAVNILPPAILFWYVHLTISEEKIEGMLWYVNRATFPTRLSQHALLIIKWPPGVRMEVEWLMWE